ncbi:MAG: hypothetical protein IKT52_00410 [Oscillospiraceae bacterium]|nr:hypothetical protein [Oscillospiraceae bacterium]
MSKLKALTEEQECILRRAGIDPEGYGLHMMDDEMIILKHFQSGLEVTIRKAGKRSWL